MLQTFVRRLARMFCEDPWQIIVVDVVTLQAPYVLPHRFVRRANLPRSRLSIPQIAVQLQQSKSHVRRLCRQLLDQRILSMHTAHANPTLTGPEWSRAQDREDDAAVWYIDYADVSNVVRFKLVEINQSLRTRDTSFESRIMYSCPSCKGEWALLDILQNAWPEGFRCEICSCLLAYTDSRSAEDIVAIQTEINFLSEMLAEIDGLKAKPLDLAKAVREAPYAFQ